MERIYCGSALKKKRSALYMLVLSAATIAAMLGLYWIAEALA